MPQAQQLQAPDWNDLARRVIEDGHQVTDAEALAMLHVPDEETLDLLAAAYRIRRHHWDNRVHLHLLMNAQSGYCPEDCGYCSQSNRSTAEIDAYPLHPEQVILEGAKHADQLQCSTYCIVMSGRGPNDKSVDAVAGAVEKIKAQYDLKVCACLGLLKDSQAERLRAAGVDRYNHNLNTSEGHTPSIVSTHTYQDRVNTIQAAKSAGISPCSGAIFGMKETPEDAVRVAMALRELDVDSIPINFLHAIPGTPFENFDELNPRQCLRLLAMMRFVNPAKEIRVAGGREVNLRTLQPLALYAANSLFVGDYLTTKGQIPEEDYRIIEDMGFQIDRKPY